MSNSVNVALDGEKPFLADPNDITLVVVQDDGTIDFYSNSLGYLGNITQKDDDDFGPHWLSVLENAGWEPWSGAMTSGDRQPQRVYLSPRFTASVVCTVTDEPSMPPDSCNLLVNIGPNQFAYFEKIKKDVGLKYFGVFQTCLPDAMVIRMEFNTVSAYIGFDPKNIRFLSVKENILKLAIGYGSGYERVSIPYSQAYEAHAFAEKILPQMPQLTEINGTEHSLLYFDKKYVQCFIPPSNASSDVEINFKGRNRHKNEPFFERIEFQSPEDQQEFLNMYARVIPIHRPIPSPS